MFSRSSVRYLLAKWDRQESNLHAIFRTCDSGLAPVVRRAIEAAYSSASEIVSWSIPQIHFAAFAAPIAIRAESTNSSTVPFQNHPRRFRPRRGPAISLSPSVGRSRPAMATGRVLAAREISFPRAALDPLSLVGLRSSRPDRMSDGPSRRVPCRSMIFCKQDVASKTAKSFHRSSPILFVAPNHTSRKLPQLPIGVKTNPERFPK